MSDLKGFAMLASDDHAIELRRLFWVGPVAVAVAVVAVKLLQIIAVGLLNPPEGSLLRSQEPAGFTAVLVALAVIVFAIVASEAANPIRTYRRIALVALVLSCVPDVALGFGLIRGEGWTLAIVFILMHIAAWAVTVSMLARLTRAQSAN
jgi:hypothetical protein